MLQFFTKSVTSFGKFSPCIYVLSLSTRLDNDYYVNPSKKSSVEDLQKEAKYRIAEDALKVSFHKKGGKNALEFIDKHVGGGPALERGPLASSCEKCIFFPDWFENLWRNNQIV